MSAEKSRKKLIKVTLPLNAVNLSNKVLKLRSQI